MFATIRHFFRRGGAKEVREGPVAPFRHHAAARPAPRPNRIRRTTQGAGVLRILAKPKAGKWNAFTGQLYSTIEKGRDVHVTEWTPIRMLLCGYDVVHLHWPDNVLNDRVWMRAAAKVLALQLALAWVRVFGRKIVWTAHNVASHHHFHPHVERLFWRFFISSLSGIICLSDESLARLRSLRKATGGIPSLVVPHGTYRGAYPNTVTRQEARARLGLKPDSRVVLNLGQLSSYKNAERLIEVGRECSEISVLIAGRLCEARYGSELRALARGISNVHLHLRFIPDDELQCYLNAADVFVLPYDDITNSGCAILSLSFGVPILAPDLPCFRSLRKRFGDDWVTLYEEGFDPGKVVRYFSGSRPGSRRTIVWDDYEWDRIAPRVRSFLKTLSAG